MNKDKEKLREKMMRETESASSKDNIHSDEKENEKDHNTMATTVGEKRRDDFIE